MTREKLPPVPMVYTSEKEVHEGAEAGKKLGHSYDMRKFEVTYKGQTFYCLGYSPANAVSRCWEGLGVQVTELKTQINTPESFINHFSNLTPEQQKEILSKINIKK